MLEKANQQIAQPGCAQGIHSIRRKSSQRASNQGCDEGNGNTGSKSVKIAGQGQDALEIVECERAGIVIGETALDNDDSWKNFKEQAEQ